jgi:L-2,4-diaminobutyrate decarboxylase
MVCASRHRSINGANPLLAYIVMQLDYPAVRKPAHELARLPSSAQNERLMADCPESKLDQQSAHLVAAYDSDLFARQAASVTELLRNHFLNTSSRDGPVWPAVRPDELIERWPDPEAGPPATLDHLLADVLAGSTHQHHPGFVGQQLSAPPPFVGPVAMLTAILNNSAAIFEGAPVAIALERRVVAWMNRKVGYGGDAAGVLTSGGSLGALTALLAMRQAKMGADVWQQGLWGAEPGDVLLSREAHYCNRRACAILGFGERAAFQVDTDARFAMSLQSLQAVYDEARSSGLRPLAVVANAGSTATGAYDDLEAIADFCQTHDLWFHVDAAHGGSALLSKRYAPLLRGIDRADSIVWDAHKMMLMPSMCTAVLFRSRAHLDNTFRQQASYLFSGQTPHWYEPAARNFETTKPAMVLPLYVALRTLGVAFLADYVEYVYDLASAFADEIQARSDFELLVRPESNIVCFRYRAAPEESDDLQLRLRDAVNRRGRFFIMRTTIRDAIWLRVVLMNPATRLADLRALLDELAEFARAS